MEPITALTLASIVAEKGPLPPERVARVGLQVAFALDAAHQGGMAHRSVQPANVIVAEDGGVRLADFGTARLQGDPGPTASGLVVASPTYMAPEQASGGQVGPPADLWGLGATMYYAVEGQAPFERASPLATLAAVANEPPRPPRHAGALAPIIMSLLAKDPAARPTLRQVRIRLARVAAAGREAGAARPAVPVAPADRFTPTPTGEFPAEAAAHDTTEPSGAPTWPAGRAGRAEWTQARPWEVALVVLGVVVTFAFLVAEVLQLGGYGRSGERGAAPTHVTSTPTTRLPASAAPQTTAPRPRAPSITAPPQRPPASQPPAGTAVESAHPPLVPASGDPLPGWIQNERYWSARLPGYRRIGSVHRGSYHGMRAAIWEYTYLPNGRPTHGLDVSFVSPSQSWGYSVLHLIPQDRWRSSQGLIRSFEQAFAPLG
jgi:hypothetical protein